jgi:fructokinase
MATIQPVVCIGEALVDMIETESDKGMVYLPAWGGSVMNVACGVARLGSAVEFAGSLSTDPLGAKLRRFIADQGVGLDLAVDIDTQTTIAMTTFVNAEPRYSFYGTPKSYGFCPPAIAAREQVVRASIVHSGSLGVLEDVTYDAMLESFKKTSGTVTFDPNVRPAMVSDWDAYRKRVGQLLRYANVVKYSIEDINALYPNSSVDTVANATLSEGASVVIVTHAGDGADVYTAAEQTRVTIPSGHDVIDTTGGGDSVMAAIIHQMAQHGTPTDHAGWVHVVNQALIVAAIVCSRRGGAIAMPTGDEARAAGATF